MAPLDETLEFFGILFSKRVCSVARCITKAMDQKFHTHDFSVLCSGALFTSVIEYLGEVFSILKFPIRVGFILIVNNVLFTLSVSSMNLVSIALPISAVIITVLTVLAIFIFLFITFQQNGNLVDNQLGKSLVEGHSEH